MKNLEKFGVQELGTQEMIEIDGGSKVGDALRWIGSKLRQAWRWTKEKVRFKVDHRYGKEWTKTV